MFKIRARFSVSVRTEIGLRTSLVVFRVRVKFLLSVQRTSFPLSHAHRPSHGQTSSTF